MLFLRFCVVTFCWFLVVGDNSLSVVQSADQSEEAEEVSVAEEEEDNKELFVATNQWQTIKKNQAIPAGLHVRLNLATGHKEAKLNEDANSVKNKPKDSGFIVSSKSKTRLTTDEIREALKSLKLDFDDQVDKQPINKNFRSIDELKKEFNDLNIQMRSETEILAKHLENYPKLKTSEKIEVLNDVEYLVHQFDVAQDFVKLGGLELLLPDLNSSDSVLRSQIVFSLGSAMQGNPKVQIAALESGVLQSLLKMLITDSSDVRLRILYAISCLVRGFPLAQKMLIESGGMTAFAMLFRNVNMQSVKLNVKVVTLLSDLQLEQQFVLKLPPKNDKFFKEKLRQYKSFNLNNSFVSEGFCQFIPKLLESPDIDVQEKIINAMNSFLDLCKSEFRSSIMTLQTVKKQLDQLVEEEPTDSDSYFAILHQSISSLITKLSSKDEL